MNLKNRVLPLALLSLLAGAVPASAAKYKIHWLLAHKNLDFFEEAAAEFKNTVEKGSKGDISVDFVTAESDGESDGLGRPATTEKIASRVEKGEAQMGHSFTDVLGTVDPRFMAFEAPYLFRGYRHLEGVFEGPAGAGLLADMNKHGMVGLSFTYSGGASGVATTGREIRKPEDLKGLKVGVYGDAVNSAWLTSLGATPVPLEHRYQSILPLSKEGGLDAVVITWRNLQRTELAAAFPRMNMMGSTHLVSVTYINEPFFKSLPKEYQELIRSAALETGRIERAKTIELNEQAKRDVTSKNVETVVVTDSGRRAFERALAPANAEIERIVGKDFVAAIKRAPDGRVHPAAKADIAGR